MASELTEASILSLGYTHPRKLPTGEWAALQRYLYTTGIVIIEDEHSWRTRWCFEFAIEARKALDAWDGTGDPPGPWIKQKPEDRLNPEWTRNNTP